MAVYVDKARMPYRRMKMCHMIADNLDELHDMATKIGVDHKWFQGNASFPHFDICQSKRELALEHGAIEVTNRELVQAMRRIREGTQK